MSKVHLPHLNVKLSEHSLGHIGPIATTVKDAAIAYCIMATPEDEHAENNEQLPIHVTGFDERDLSGIRIGVYNEYFKDATQEVVDACLIMLEHLKKSGAQVVDVSIPHIQELKLAHSVTILTEIGQYMDPHYKNLSKHSYETQITLSFARSLEACDFLAAQRLRAYAMRISEHLFQQCDVFITPATACTAPYMRPEAISKGESNLKQTASLMQYVTLGNFIGIPGIALPIEYDGQGLPIGLQLQAQHWNEALILRMANIVSQFVTLKKPSVYYSIIDRATRNHNDSNRI